MVLETYLAPVLNQILGDYVDNLESKQLNVGIWSGDLVLHNLRLRRDALDKFNLPVDVVEGYLGELILNIPWNDLKNKPVRISVDRVYLLAVPRRLGDYYPEEEEEKAFRAKQEKLAAWQSFRKTEKDMAIDAKGTSFVTQLVTKIVDNLQITMKNIHIRFEDTESDPEAHFAVGITLDELSAVSTDENWLEAFIHEELGIIHKLAKMGSLAVYWNTDEPSFRGKSFDECIKSGIAKEGTVPNHQYLMKPVSGIGKFTISRKQRKESAMYEGDLNFKDLSFSLDAGQYGSLLSVMSTFTMYSKAAKYRKFRPPLAITPTIDPRAWLRYAVTCVLNDIHEKHRQWTWDYFAERRDMRIAYIQAFKQKALGKASEEDEQTLATLERVLTFRDIRFYRIRAEAQLKRDKTAADLSAQSTAIAPARPAQQQGWFSGWWGAAPTAPTPEAASKVSNESSAGTALTETQIKQIYETIEFDPDSDISDPTLDRDALLFKLNFTLQSGALELRRSIGAGTGGFAPLMMSIVFDRFGANVLKYPQSLFVEVALRGMSVFDGTTPGNLYPTFVRAKPTKGFVALTSPTSESRDNTMNEDETFFKLVYENNPIDEHADQLLSIRMLPLEVIYNPNAIKSLVKFFSPSSYQFDASATITAIRALAHDALEGIRSQTSAGLQFAIEEHKTFDLKIDIDAPIFVFPESNTDPGALVLVIDAGHFLIESNMVDKAMKDALRKQHENTEASSQNQLLSKDQLTEFLYDKFTCSLTSAQILIGPSFESCLTEVQTSSTSRALHLIERVDVAFRIEWLILSKTVQFTRLKISGELPRLRLNLTDRKYKSLMRIIDIVLASLSNGETAAEQATAAINALQTTSRTLEWDYEPSDLGTDIEGDDSFFDAQEHVTDAATSVVTDAFVKRILTDFTFNVHEVSVLLAQSHTKGNNHTPLAELFVSEFQLQYVQRSFDLSASVQIKDVRINDLVSNKEFPHLFSKTLDNAEENTSILTVSFTRVDASSPEYTGIRDTVDINFSLFEIVLTRKSILNVYDFVLRTFTGAGSQTTVTAPQNDALGLSAQEQSTQNNDERSITQEKSGASTNELNMRVHITLKGTRIVINEEGKVLGLLKSGGGEVTILFRDSKLQLKGTIGDLLLLDELPRPKGNQLFKELLSIEGDKTADFTYETFNRMATNYPGYDSSLIVQASSMQLTYVRSTFQRLQNYFSEFSRMSSLLESARQAAVESAAQIQQTAGTKFHFDVHVSSPIIVIPNPGLTSKSSMKMYLGELTAKNDFLSVQNRGVMNRISAELKSMKLLSLLSETSLGYEELKMLEDLNIQYSSASPSEEGTTKTAQVTVRCSEIKLAMTSRQYAFTLDLLQSFGQSEAKPVEASMLKSTVVHTPAPTIENLSTDTVTDYSFSLPKITMEIFTLDESHTRIQGLPLARFSINGTDMKMVQRSSGAMDMELLVSSINLLDTRLETKSVFRDVISHSDNEHLLMVQMSRAADSTSYIVTLDTPHVVLALDHMFAIRGFFLDPHKVDDLSPDSSRNAAIGTPTDLQAGSLEEDDDWISPQPTISYRVNMVDAEVVLVRTPTDQDTEAIILSCGHVVVSHEMITTFSAQGLGMFFCSMDRIEFTKVRFIDNFDITLAMDSRMTGPGHKLMSVNLGISPLMVRISYHDVQLISDILRIATNLSNGPAAKRIEPKETAAVNLPLSPTALTKADDLVMSRETFTMTSQGMRLVIIDDLNDLHLPMLDFAVQRFEGEISNWTSELRVDTAFSLQVNYFNLKNSHWEPLLEPWQAVITASRINNQLQMEFSSKTKLELNLTHTFLETLFNTRALWAKTAGRDMLTRRGVHAPYIFRNRTGYDMHIWSDGEGDSSNVELTLLKNGNDAPWRFDEWRAMRENIAIASNKVSIQLEGEWETLKAILVDQEATRQYTLRPALDRVSHKLVCEVKLKNNIKVVTFRSATILHNGTKMNIEVMLVTQDGKPQSKIKKIAPDEDYYVPIESAYYDRIFVRPEQGFGYSWSSESLFWRDLQKANTFPLVSCPPQDRFQSACMFQISPSFAESSGKQNLKYPELVIKLLPPFTLENLLPYDFKYVLYDKVSGQKCSDILEKGGQHPIHTLDPTHVLALEVEIPEPGVYKRSDLAIVCNPDADFRDETLTIRDHQNLELFLKFKYSDNLQRGGKKVTVFSSYVLVNKTGLNMFFTAKSLITSARMAAGQASKTIRNNEVLPLMFSYSNFEPLRSRTQIKAGSSEWSKPLSFEVAGSMFGITIPNADSQSETYLGVTVKEGEGKYYSTKVVTFAPRFILVNNCSENIKVYTEEGLPEGSALLVESKQSVPLTQFKTREGEHPKIALRFDGLTTTQSSFFNIDQLGRVFVKLGRVGSDHEDLVRCEIMLQEATIFIILTREDGRWPIRIDNKTGVDVIIYQQGAKNRYRIGRGGSRQFAWDYPSSPKKALMLFVNGVERELDILEVGQLQPFKYQVNGRIEVMAIDVAAEGPQIALQLAPYVESESRYKSKDETRESGDEFELTTKEEDVQTIVTIRLEGIGVSLITQSMQEFLYASIKQFAFIFTNGTLTQTVGFEIMWMQIDNQVYGAAEPILMYPTVISKRDQIHRPVLWGSVSKSKDSSYGVDYYHYFTILLQELSFDLDEAVLVMLTDYFRFSKRDDDAPPEKLVDSNSGIPTPSSSEGEIRMYFENLLLQPIQLNFTFSRASATKRKDEDERPSSLIAFVVEVLTATIGNVHNAPIRLNALNLRHPIVTFSQLIDLITKFYSQEVVGQFHKVIGSADFLGNPIGLFQNVSSGVTDLFYEPLQGLELARPQDFTIGLAKGGASFFKKTVFGLSDTFSKFTGSVGKGLSVITLDEEFQEQRRLRNRNRPRHAVYGVTNGVGSFAESVFSGVTGLLVKPIEGAGREGVGGFFKGLGKGVIGVATKPVLGVFDLATNVAEGIRNTTTVFDTEIDRQRYPRHIGSDGILKAYDQRQALGLSWLKGVDNGRFFGEEYVAHLELRLEDLVAMVTDRRTAVLRIKRLKVEWSLPYEDLKKASVESSEVILATKGFGGQQSESIRIPCADPTSAKWLHGIVESAFSSYLSSSRS
ncbi:hypothetical protein BJ742DRAFT_753443 [Cladochytrium replicatum]|nr:hypothetical protein BJ742DRAFT_753443 [Cladochytrium replicatum]